jgi:hypothetical protein
MLFLVKHLKIFHLPWTETLSKEDKILKDLSFFENKEVVLTEKMDGENTTLYPDHIHARSLNFNSHWSRNWVRNFHAKLKYRIPKNFRICGENMYATHSIFYENLESYFLVHSVWDSTICLSWDDTKYICEDISYKDVRLVTVPEIWKGMFYDPSLLQSTYETWKNTKKCEGYVIRLANMIEFAYYQKSVAKWVRKDHVQTNGHWFYNIKKSDSTNRLKE